MTNFKFKIQLNKLYSCCIGILHCGENVVVVDDDDNNKDDHDNDDALCFKQL